MVWFASQASIDDFQPTAAELDFSDDHPCRIPQPFQWTPVFELEEEASNAKFREIFELVGDLEQHPHDLWRVKNILDATSVQFRKEEAKMKELQVSCREGHEALHQAFEEDCAELIEKVKSSRLSKRRGRGVLESEILFIKNFFVQHIVKEDRKVDYEIRYGCPPPEPLSRNPCAVSSRSKEFNTLMSSRSSSGYSTSRSRTSSGSRRKRDRVLSLKGGVYSVVSALVSPGSCAATPKIGHCRRRETTPHRPTQATLSLQVASVVFPQCAKEPEAPTKETEGDLTSTLKHLASRRVGALLVDTTKAGFPMESGSVELSQITGLNPWDLAGRQLAALRGPSPEDARDMKEVEEYIQKIGDNKPMKPLVLKTHLKAHADASDAAAICVVLYAAPLPTTTGDKAVVLLVDVTDCAPKVNATRHSCKAQIAQMYNPMVEDGRVHKALYLEQPNPGRRKSVLGLNK